MIDHMKVIAALIAVALGFTICILQAIQTNWLSSLSALILGSCVGFNFLVGPLALKEFPLAYGAAALAGLIGLFAIFYEHPAFNTDLSRAHSEALDAFISMQFSCAPLSGDLRSVREAGIMACALQDKSDLLDAAKELQISRLLGPTTSLIDQTYSAIKKPRTDWCAAAFIAADRLCPAGFVTIDDKLKNVLRQ